MWPAAVHYPRGNAVANSTQLWRRWLAPAIKIAVVALVIWGVRRSLIENIEQFDQLSARIRWPWFIFAGAIYLVSLLPAVHIWRLALGALGQHPSFGATLRAYSIGHLGKYVPGKAMVVVIRAGLLAPGGVDPAMAAVAVFYETFSFLAAGSVTAAVLMLWWHPQEHLLVGAAISLAIVAVIPTLPPVFRRLARAANRFQTSGSPPEFHWPGRLRLVGAWLLLCLGWVGQGISLWACLRGLGMELAWYEHLATHTATVTMAVAAGFFALIPAGAVVREAVLARLLTPLYGESEGLLAAVSLRLIWLMAELAISIILYPMGWLGRRERALTLERARSRKT
jgi:uncharacterized membrane protein YbhN (UPF0104 family)